MPIENPVPKPDWDAIKRERLAAVARFNAFPEPTESTVEECIAALRAEGCPEPIVSGVGMTFEEGVAKGVFPLGDLQSLLKDWRWLKAEPPRAQNLTPEA
jgi:hypothetical protein